MKTTYETVFASHVAAKITKAKELGIKASWSTANHLDALADCITQSVGEIAELGGGTGETKERVRDCLGECYNVSAFQQMLAKKFEALGHFQREGKKPVSEQADDVFAQLARDAAKG